MLSRLRSFLDHLLNALRSQAPYWALAWLIGCINLVFNMFEVHCFLPLLGLYGGIGAYVVFRRFKTPVLKTRGATDVRSAWTNLYRALWWPWYVAAHLERRGKK